MIDTLGKDEHNSYAKANKTRSSSSNFTAALKFEDHVDFDEKSFLLFGASVLYDTEASGTLGSLCEEQSSLENISTSVSHSTIFSKCLLKMPPCPAISHAPSLSSWT